MMNRREPWNTRSPLLGLAVCQREYGVPLAHYWKDGDYGVYGDNPHRHAGIWDSVAGWYGHGDVPSLPLPNRQEDHWDPGALKWSELLAKAAAMTDIVHAPAWTPPVAPARPCASCAAPAASPKRDAALVMQAAVKAFQVASGFTGDEVDGDPGSFTRAAYLRALAGP